MEYTSEVTADASTTDKEKWTDDANSLKKSIKYVVNNPVQKQH